MIGWFSLNGVFAVTRPKKLATLSGHHLVHRSSIDTKLGRVHSGPSRKKKSSMVYVDGFKFRIGKVGL